MSEHWRLEAHAWFRADPDEWLQTVVEAHFHLEHGAPYWIERAAELGLDPRRDLRSVHDLIRLGPFDVRALKGRPVEQFLPRAVRERPSELLCVETSGTTGPPATACYSRADFRGAFVASFRPVARAAGFPPGAPWLFVGPTGPHAIGHAARELPRVLESPEPFAVDFDPRWARKLPEDSLARQRYMEHLLDQAVNVLEREPVAVLFATPPVLLALAERLDEERRQRIRGIHFGGMEATAAVRLRLREAFPRAATLSGYGNSLFGVALETGGADDRPLDYFPAGPRHLIRVVRDAADLAADVDHGESGRIVMSRLDLSGFYPNVIERDVGIRIPASPAARSFGFLLDGVRDPHPPRVGPRVRTGFY